jgi:hypothetical protein
MLYIARVGSVSNSVRMSVTSWSGTELVSTCPLRSTSERTISLIDAKKVSVARCCLAIALRCGAKFAVPPLLLPTVGAALQLGCEGVAKLGFGLPFIPACVNAAVV